MFSNTILEDDEIVERNIKRWKYKYKAQLFNKENGYMVIISYKLQDPNTIIYKFKVYFKDRLIYRRVFDDKSIKKLKFVKNKKWTIEDDLFIIETLLANYKTREWNEIIKSISDDIGTTQSSVKMRILNYISILTNGEKGLKNYAEESLKAINLSLGKYSKSQLLIAFH